MTAEKFYSTVTRTRHEQDRAAVKRVSAAVLRARRDRLTMDEVDQVFAQQLSPGETRDVMSQLPKDLEKLWAETQSEVWGRP
jgi:uncharacterized protein (DUF2267 family)